MRLHIFGASGSGTTTLAEALAKKHDLTVIDIDDIYWLPTDPAFSSVRAVRERTSLLESSLARAEHWALSGSLCGWGDPVIPLFELAVFMSAPTEVRLARLRARELERFGAEALAPGGAMHTNHGAFMDWAATYETGGPEMRSRAMHEAWLSTLPCPSLGLDGVEAVETLVEKVQQRWLEIRA